MHKIAKYAIVVNSILGLLFVSLNFVFYYYDHLREGIVVLWNPLWLTFFSFRSIGDIGIQYPNFAFYLFWVLMVVNLLFILMMSREK
jgi:hypothetical protein